MGLPKHTNFAQNLGLGAIAVIASAILLWSAAKELGTPAVLPTLKAESPAPASLGGELPAAKNLQHFGTARLATLELGCLEPAHKELSTEADIIRFAAKLCGQRKSRLREVEVVQKTKSTTLVGIYDPYSKLIATEFFPLQPGKNRIDMNLKFENGENMRSEFQIEHKSATSTEKK